MDKLPSLKNFIQEIYQIWISEKPNQLAAALAYFGMFSFAAVIYLALSISRHFYQRSGCRRAILHTH